MVDRPDKILPSDAEATDRIFPSSPVGQGAEKLAGSSQQPFSSFMKEGQSSPLVNAGKTPMVSPFDLMQGRPLAQGATPTMDTLVAQVNSTQSTMGDISSQLNTPNLKLKASQKYLLKNKLTDATDSMRSANAKMGANVPEATDPSTFSGPLGKFFAYLSDGQKQMESAKQQLQSIKDKGDSMSPGDFLLVQVKLNKAQQELEFSSVLLSNAVSDLKMLMQVQL
ncbi:MAG: hypothetical protein HYX67_10325 [Candidatus Melainabacteria bacterium]|nr:hypothetical protein [Candidatus Melainabacteria bacterium]